MTSPDGLAKEALVEMYRKMRLIRRFEETMLDLRAEGRIYGVVHPYIGEEAVAVGAMAALRPTDKIISHHRGHGHLIAKGADVRRMMAELFGRSSGYCKGKGGSMHIADFASGILGANGVVGAGLPIGAGAALASQLLDRDTVVMAFFGDGATGQGVFHESLMYSSIARLPIVWLCENNQYAVETPLSNALPIADVAPLATGYGLPSAVVDGIDPLAVYEACRKAVDRAREGAGPTLLECKTYRWGLHVQRAVKLADKRPQEQLIWARIRDPIEMWGRWLVETGTGTQEQLAAIRREVEREVKSAVDFAERSPFPETREALLDVWAE